DIAIIGTGAGGGTLARALAPTGKRILILERGEYLPREFENWDTDSVFAKGRYLAPETWYDEHDQPFKPYTHYWVGGNTKVYGAALLRLRPRDFGEIEHFGGVSPSWPIGYDDLEPFYTRAEEVYCVRGRRGSDPYEPPSERDFPQPPVPLEPTMQELFDDLTGLGYRPFPIPLGVRLPACEAGQSPYRLGHFDGYPDPTEVKSDAHVCGVRPAAAHANVTLMTRARVDRLETDASGRRVTQIVIDHDGERCVVRSDVVVIACGAINSAALLLRSRSERWPRGLANSSDQVGRNYMCHQNGCVSVVTHEPNPSPFQKGFGLTEFYFGASDAPRPLGTLQLMGKPDPGTLAWLRGDALPGESLEGIAGRTVDWFITAEDLPSPDNRVTLREDGSIRLTYRRNNTEAYDRLLGKLREAMERVEHRRGRTPPVLLHQRLGVSGVSHQNGTLRMGHDAATSVVNPDGKAHDLENLYVCDGSVFPSSGAVNPSLTIMAWALRLGEHLARVTG
ncbi:MAG: GMC family oxidoreductase, partial [Phycisphaerales bacterium]|nr:GMC family oxidoreductase [Phycisphaerales bacterium]